MIKGWRKYIGLRFRRELPQDHSVLIDLNIHYPDQMKIRPVSISMLWVRFPLRIFCIDPAGKVVDVINAKPWRIYKSMQKVRFIYEMNPSDAMNSSLTLGSDAIPIIKKAYDQELEKAREGL